jgi:hypothetical protein
VWPLTERSSEKYLKKLFRNTDNWTDVEDGLKRLDRMTQEEAEMAAAQVLKATHAVDDAGRVRGVADIALGVDNRVAGVGDQVQGVSNQIQGVGDQLTTVIDGTQDNFDQLSKLSNPWKRGQGSCATSSRRCRSSETFVIFEPHSCQTYRLKRPHRESITTGSS